MAKPAIGSWFFALFIDEDLWHLRYAADAEVGSHAIREGEEEPWAGDAERAYVSSPGEGPEAV